MTRLPPISVHDLGGYLREQREHAQLSLRQLADVAGISNPYLSQIERGLKRPSAEILQALAKGLRISAETLYVKAGLLEEGESLTPATAGHHPVDVRAAVLADPRLTDRQRGVLLDVYDSFVGEQPAPAGPRPSRRPTLTSVPTGTPGAPRRARPAPATTNPQPGGTS